MIELEDIRSGTGDHVVQFYERDSDLVRTVSGYVLDGLQAGEAVVVLATEVHRRRFGWQLEDLGCDVSAAIAGGRLLWLDAATTLAQFCVGGKVDHHGFLATIGDVLGQAAAHGRPLRAYGEMVALLWDEGHVAAAIELEELWNELRQEIPTGLFCAYRSDSVSGPGFEDALRDVCGLHSAVLDRDARYWAPGLGPTESTEVARDFEATPEAPRKARRFVVDELRRQGYGETVVDDAALVLTELASNALVHAGTGFTVILASLPLGRVRMSVKDGSAELPAPRHEDLTAATGRGLSLVAALASGWGMERLGAGKVVWAELRP